MAGRDLYLERYIERFRHVEVQVLRDRAGNTYVLGHRDCSAQRNHQKLVEESSSTLLSPRLKQQAYDAARDLAIEVEYVGAGTVEFMLDLERNELYFMEMNARLQVEHPVTEAVTGVDIVGAPVRYRVGICPRRPPVRGARLRDRSPGQRRAHRPAGRRDGDSWPTPER